jgi:predicted transcriptional regulator
MPTNLLGDNEMETKILKNIEKHSTGTWIEKIARELDLNRATVRNYVIRLEVMGKVKLEKKGQIKMIFPINDGGQ